MAEMLLLGRCGLSCGLCTEHSAGVCHGSGCAIAQCVAKRGLLTCANCPDMPCSSLIHFAYDPIWRTLPPVIESLRRIKRIGLEAWLDGQRAFFGDDRQRQRWLDLHGECGDLNRQRRRQNPA